MIRLILAGLAVLGGVLFLWWEIRNAPELDEYERPVKK